MRDVFPRLAFFITILQNIVKRDNKSYSLFMTNDHLTITTPRLTLHPFVLADTIPLHRILNQPNILQYYPNPAPPDMQRVKKIIERQQSHWAEHGYGWWAVVPHGGTELIGWNGLQYLPETDEVEVGYLLSKSFWGCGYATEGAKASIQFGVENFKFEEIIGITHPKNTASQNVLKKCGMHFTGEARYFDMQVHRFSLQTHTRM
jgi:ribosomal-protein-alanine N-acetyltransferase